MLSLTINVLTETAEKASAMGGYGFVCADRDYRGVLLL
jgi:hypothetical protein